MQNGLCPRCGLSEVRRRPFKLKPATIDVYVCVRCGYSESYVQPAMLRVIEFSGVWERVESAPNTPSTGRTIRLNAAQPAAAAPGGTGKLNRACPVCRGSEIIPNVRVLDRVQGGAADLTAAIDRNPEALIFRGTVHSALSAWICRSCGHSMFFADDPEAIYDAYHNKA